MPKIVEPEPDISEYSGFAASKLFKARLTSGYFNSKAGVKVFLKLQLETGEL